MCESQKAPMCEKNHEELRSETSRKRASPPIHMGVAVLHGLTLDDRLSLFQDMRGAYLFVSSAAAAAMIGLAALAPDAASCALATALFFALVLIARHVTGRLTPHPTRRLNVLGMLWLSAALLHGALILAGSRRHGQTAGASRAVVRITAAMMGLAPVLMRLCAVHAMYRLSTCICLTATYMATSQLLMDSDGLDPMLIAVAALLSGEVLALHIILHSLERRIAVGRTSETKLPRCYSSLAKQQAAAHQPAKEEAPRWNTQLKSFLQQRAFDPESARMTFIATSFTDTEFEILYGTSAFALSLDIHCFTVLASFAVCVLSALSMPTFDLALIIPSVFYALVLAAYQHMAGDRDLPRAYLKFCLFCARLTCICAAATLVDSLALRQDSPKTNSEPRLLDAMTLLVQSRAHTLTVDPVASSCCALLLILAGAHHWLIVLPQPMRTSNRLATLVWAICSHINTTLEPGLDAVREPSQTERVISTIMPMFWILVGELAGMCIDRVRRKLFLECAIELRHRVDESVKTTARLECMSASTQELERKNASHRAELAADKRLNHVIKGRCGSAISAVETFNQLVGPYLKMELPNELSDLLVAPLTHLREAIEWCHRRQFLVQLEEMTYVSRHTPVDINQILETSLSNSGTLYSNIDDPIALDETALKICLDEVISNALKYRRARSSLRMEARFAEGMLYVAVENENPAEFVMLTPEECKRVFQAGYKSHTCSAMSDGLGLDTVLRAINAVGGAVELRQSKQATTVHLSIPATLRMRTQLKEQPTPEHSRRASVRSVVKYAPKETLCSPKLMRRTSLKSCTSSTASPLSSVQSPCGTELVTKDSHAQCRKVSSLVNRSCLTSGSSPCWTNRARGQPQNGSPISPLCRRSLGGEARSTSPSHEPPHLHDCAKLKLPERPPLCIGLTNPNDLSSLFLSALFVDHLQSADSLVMTSSLSGCSEFISRVLGKPDGSGTCYKPVDIVVMSYKLNNVDGRGGYLAGAQMAQKLRALGFRGMLCVLVNDQTDLEVHELCSQPAVDIVIHKSSRVEEVGQSLLERYLSESRTRPAADIARTSACDQLKPTASRCAGTAPTEVKPTLSMARMEDKASRLKALDRIELEGEAPDVHGDAVPNHATVMGRSRNSWKSPIENASAIPGRATRSSSIVTESPSELTVPTCIPTPNDLFPVPSLESSLDVCVANPNANVIPSRKLRVVGLDDERIPRMIQSLFAKHHLKADMDASCMLGETKAEIESFIDVALGLLDAALNPTSAAPADIVMMDENISPPETLGSQLAIKLRRRGFKGIIAILTGASCTHAEQIRKLPAVDFVFDKGFSLSKMAEAILGKIVACPDNTSAPHPAPSSP